MIWLIAQCQPATIQKEGQAQDTCAVRKPVPLTIIIEYMMRKGLQQMASSQHTLAIFLSLCF